jgi:hypothetical protein
MKEEKDFQGAHGGLAEDEPLPGRSHSRSETRDITLSSLQRAAALVGQRVVVELV